MPGAPHNGREDRAGSVVPGEPGLHHSGSIVAHKRRYFSVVSHWNLQPVCFNTSGTERCMGEGCGSHRNLQVYTPHVKHWKVHGRRMCKPSMTSVTACKEPAWLPEQEAGCGCSTGGLTGIF